MLRYQILSILNEIVKPERAISLIILYKRTVYRTSGQKPLVKRIITVIVKKGPRKIITRDIVKPA